MNKNFDKFGKGVVVIESERFKNINESGGGGGCCSSSIIINN